MSSSSSSLVFLVCGREAFVRSTSDSFGLCFNPLHAPCQGDSSSADGTIILANDRNNHVSLAACLPTLATLNPSGRGGKIPMSVTKEMTQPHYTLTIQPGQSRADIHSTKVSYLALALAHLHTVVSLAAIR